jgi:hypothetical protein
MLLAILALLLLAFDNHSDQAQRDAGPVLAVPVADLVTVRLELDSEPLAGS